jgi:hypothetical protein
MRDGQLKMTLKDETTVTVNFDRVNDNRVVFKTSKGDGTWTYFRGGNSQQLAQALREAGKAIRLTILEEWTEALKRFQTLEWVEDALPDLYVRYALATDPFEWSSISGEWGTKPTDAEKQWMIDFVFWQARCVLLWGPYDEASASWVNGEMVDGQTDLLEWDWVDSSTAATQDIGLRFRLMPDEEWREEWKKFAASLPPPAQGKWYWYGEEISEAEFRRRQNSSE